jgi:deoxycytidylate deaminase
MIFLNIKLYLKYNMQNLNRRINNMCLDRLIRNAKNSSISAGKLSAAIIKNGRLYAQPCVNTQRNTCRGSTCGSWHAEQNALLNYYGKDIAYSKKNGWYLCPKERCIKKEG